MNKKPLNKISEGRSGHLSLKILDRWFFIFTVLSSRKLRKIKLHSSRMHTARLLTVSPSMHCAWGVPALRGACSRGGVSAPGGGGLLPGRVVSQHALKQTLPPSEQNSWHTLLKILPCPKLGLRAVKIGNVSKLENPGSAAVCYNCNNLLAVATKQNSQFLMQLMLHTMLLRNAERFCTISVSWNQR